MPKGAVPTGLPFGSLISHDGVPAPAPALVTHTEPELHATMLPHPQLLELELGLVFELDELDELELSDEELLLELELLEGDEELELEEGLDEELELLDEEELELDDELDEEEEELDDPAMTSKLLLLNSRFCGGTLDPKSPV